MPQRILCYNCKQVLYEGVGLKLTDEIISLYGGKRPKCNRELNELPIDAEVKPTNKR